MSSRTLPDPRYVPVLKVKPGEKGALQMLAPAIVRETWPLFEIVEMKPKPDEPPPTLTKHVQKAFHGLREAIRQFPVYLLDAHEIAPAGREGARSMFEAATNLGRPFIPVTGISRTADPEEAFAAARDTGIAIRLTRAEFEKGMIPGRLEAFIAAHHVAPSRVHLIVDLGAVEDALPEGVEQMIRQFLPLVPRILEWRTLIVSSCAFPMSMGVAQTKSTTAVERADWKGWMSACHARRKTLARLPIYSDGAIQHPSGVEGYLPGVMPWSAAIRYALPDEWLIVKGESTDLTPGRDQFPELARRLIADARFAGAEHCHACAEIVRASRGPAKGLKTPLDWRRIGTAHHIMRTVQQLRSLPAP